MKALIPAAGLGTRFLPATKAQPKEMLLVIDKPVIQYVVEEGLASSADEVVIINSRDKKIIEDHGGYVWATSKEGEGTCMHFVIRKWLSGPEKEWEKGQNSE